MNPVQRIAFIGNHLPRQCGIATFTHDLHQAVAAARPSLATSVVAMTDPGRSYAYPEFVRVEVRDAERDDYIKAADALNAGRFDVVSLQHEFGIFGGAAGSHIMELLARLDMPVVTTLHSVLQHPSDAQRAVMQQLTMASRTLVVMAEKGRALLRSVYAVPNSRIEVIPHGIPDFPLLESRIGKAKLGFSGRTVILTFGLLSPSKGIESVIDAMPGIIQACPNAVYVVLGATHPNLLRDEGESYRDSLIARAAELGVAVHVVFVNQFVDQPALLDYISMCDVYVTPYLNEAQMTSGTLAYSFGLGKPVVSTPYWHARELLADGKGVLVPFGDAKAIGAGVAGLLTDDSSRNAMRERAYAASRPMTWAPTATRYLAVLDAARNSAFVSPVRAAIRATSRPARQLLPEPRTEQLLSLCDSTGLMQHAVHGIPDRSHGYCVDDNARALLLACQFGQPGSRPLPDVMATRFAAFIQHAWNPDTRRFRNFMSYDRRWLEPQGSEDSHGRTLWALGQCARHDTDPARRCWAADLFATALPVVEEFAAPRAWAFTLLGLDGYCQAAPADRSADRIRRVLADRLLHLCVGPRPARWPQAWNWFENVLAYDNARLPQALLQTGLRLKSPAYVTAGLSTLRWLMAMQTAPMGHFRPVGSDSFGQRFAQPRPFDQQPVEAAATISACLLAAQADTSAGWPVSWKAEAWRAFAWFTGDNDLRLPLIDPLTGGCYDGLHPDRANANMGAESVLSYLLGLSDMRALHHITVVNESILAGKLVYTVDRSEQAPRIAQGSRLVPIPVVEPARLAPAPRSGAGRGPAIQTGN